MSNYNWSDDEPGPYESWETTYLKALGAAAAILVCFVVMVLFV